MKARRKSDGEIIEVKEWRCVSDIIYFSPDINRYYQASDLDFNLDAEGTVIQGWASRDKDGALIIWESKPQRNDITNDEWGMTDGIMLLPSKLFPDLTWSDEPQEVEIIIKRKKK